MAIAFALISAVVYGASDYLGGRVSRRVPAVTVALIAETTMLVGALVIVPLVESSSPSAAAVRWGLIGGAAGSLSVVGLYVTLARGNMTVVAPITGVVAAVVPVAVGVALGERPGRLAVVGIACAVIAVAIIGGAADAIASRVVQRVDVRTVVMATVVGVGFGVLFIAYSRTGDSGLWPLLTSRFSGLPLLSIAFVAQRRRTPGPAFDRSAIGSAVAIGGLIAVANGTYLISTREGLLSVVAVVVAMYPASTICLASAIDRERATRLQLVGMAIAAAALAMITIGS